MGYIDVQTAGSFPTRHARFPAVDRGHAHAVAAAIRWLADEVLPAAIEQDHRLAARGVEPRLGFAAPRGSDNPPEPGPETVGLDTRPRP